MEKKILYSAVVLDPISRSGLLVNFSDLIPLNWKLYLHHMTICFGSGLPDNLKNDLGKTVELEIVSIGLSDKALAFGVRGYESSNKNPHITFAIDVINGGKPKDSNDIVIWESLSVPIKVTGVVSEITN